MKHLPIQKSCWMHLLKSSIGSNTLYASQWTLSTWASLCGLHCSFPCRPCSCLTAATAAPRCPPSTLQQHLFMWMGQVRMSTCSTRAPTSPPLLPFLPWNSPHSNPKPCQSRCVKLRSHVHCTHLNASVESCVGFHDSSSLMLVTVWMANSGSLVTSAWPSTTKTNRYSQRSLLLLASWPLTFNSLFCSSTVPTSPRSFILVNLSWWHFLITGTWKKFWSQIFDLLPSSMHGWVWPSCLRFLVFIFRWYSIPCELSLLILMLLLVMLHLVHNMILTVLLSIHRQHWYMCFVLIS